MRILISISFLLIISSCKKQDLQINNPTDCTFISADHPLNDTLSKVINRFVKSGIPGITIAIKDANGTWMKSAGFSKIETLNLMAPCNVFFGYSTTKLYMATLVMILKEKNLINLDNPITQYLDEGISKKIDNSRAITVRMLLNHTSGIPDCLKHNTQYELLIASAPLSVIKREDELNFIDGKKLLFTPGSDYFYSNTNYILISYIIEKVTGKDHALVLKDEILDKYGLNETYYKLQAGYPDKLPIPNYYFDRFDNGSLENVTKWGINEDALSAYGSNGIMATPIDYINFLKKLLNNEIISSASLQEMKTWVMPKGETAPVYGLGLDHFNYGNKEQYGHGGSGMGSTRLIYFPNKNAYVFIAMNVSTNSSMIYSNKVFTAFNRLATIIANN